MDISYYDFKERGVDLEVEDMHYNYRDALRAAYVLGPPPSTQDMKRSFVCASSCIKHYLQPFIWLPSDARSRRYVCLYCVKKIFTT